MTSLGITMKETIMKKALLSGLSLFCLLLLTGCGCDCSTSDADRERIIQKLTKAGDNQKQNNGRHYKIIASDYEELVNATLIIRRTGPEKALGSDIAIYIYDKTTAATDHNDNDAASYSLSGKSKISEFDGVMKVEFDGYISETNKTDGDLDDHRTKLFFIEDGHDLVFSYSTIHIGHYHDNSKVTNENLTHKTGHGGGRG